jgi:hypothetical protein
MRKGIVTVLPVVIPDAGRPDAARNFGRGVSTGFIHSLSWDLANSLVAIEAETSKAFSDAVLKSLREACARAGDVEAA